MALFAGIIVFVVILMTIMSVAMATNRVTRIKCRKCSGTKVSSDPYRYRGVVCHLCEDCGEVYETMRTR